MFMLSRLSGTASSRKCTFVPALTILTILCAFGMGIMCGKHNYSHYTHNHLMAFDRDNPGRPVPEETHPLTPILIIGHPLSSSSTYNDQWHPLCSFYVLDSHLVQPLSRSSLVFLLVLDPQLHTPYISSPNHHHIFAAYAHTNAACSAAIPMNNV